MFLRSHLGKEGPELITSVYTFDLTQLCPLVAEDIFIISVGESFAPDVVLFPCYFFLPNEGCKSVFRSCIFFFLFRNSFYSFDFKDLWTFIRTYLFVSRAHDKLLFVDVFTARVPPGPPYIIARSSVGGNALPHRQDSHHTPSVPTPAGGTGAGFSRRDVPTFPAVSSHHGVAMRTVPGWSGCRGRAGVSD